MPTYIKLQTLILALSICFSCQADAANEAQDPFAHYPVIKIKKREHIKVAYDVLSDDWEAGVGRALYYARGLIEAYAAQGVPHKNLQISVVVHGAAAYWLLNDEAYRKKKLDPFDINPNEKIIKELIDHGVSVEMCMVTMKGKGWTPDELLPGVHIVHDAYTRLIELQQQGYAYLHF